MADNDDQNESTTTETTGETGSETNQAEGLAPIQDALKGLQDTLVGGLASIERSVKPKDQDTPDASTILAETPAASNTVPETDEQYYGTGAVKSTQAMIDASLERFDKTRLKPKEEENKRVDDVRLQREIDAAAKTIVDLDNYEDLKADIMKSAKNVADVMVLTEPQFWENTYCMHQGKRNLASRRAKAQGNMPPSDVSRQPADEGPSQGAIDMGRKMGLSEDEVRSGHKKARVAKLRSA